MCEMCVRVCEVCVRKGVDGELPPIVHRPASSPSNYVLKCVCACVRAKCACGPKGNGNEPHVGGQPVGPQTRLDPMDETPPSRSVLRAFHMEIFEALHLH